MAATSRTIAKSSAAVAFNLFNNSKPILNRQLPQHALPAVTKLVNEQFFSEWKIAPKQEQVWISKPRSAAEKVNMMMVIETAHRQQKVPYVDEGEGEDDEVEDDSDFEMIDEEDDEFEDEDDFEDEDEEFVNSKVRTRSHRDL